MRQHDLGSALCALASELPADESMSAPAKILQLDDALSKPAAQGQRVRLRLLTIRGLTETNYDAGEALPTWQEVQRLALKQGALKLATRAEGEQGIAAYLLGDIQTARRQVVGAITMSKVENDPAATVRYAAIYSRGLVESHKYKEALTVANGSISLAAKHPEIAYPTIAVYAKIAALTGLGEYAAALDLDTTSLRLLEGTPYDAHRQELYDMRGSIERQQRKLEAAVADYGASLAISRRIENYRGIADTNGSLAETYILQNRFPEALTAINEAIEANTKIPFELYLVPRNLAIRADIQARLGHRQEADASYRKAIALVNQFMRNAPTTGLQRSLLADMSNVYSGYFALLCNQGRYNEALQILDNVRGRVEAEALQHHETKPVHVPTAEEKEVTRLNISLINTDDPTSRTAIANSIYTAEMGLGTTPVANQTITHPVKLADLQNTLGPNAVLVEYVLASPASYALAITHTSVKQYQLPARDVIEDDAKQYTKELRSQKEDKPLAAKLFGELLQPLAEYQGKTDLTIIPDGELHLLPFSALQDSGGYVLASHTVNVNPSATVYALLHQRVEKAKQTSLPYIGVAAWTQQPPSRNPFTRVVRAVSGPQRSELVPLPESKEEVESIAKDLPLPSTILEGADATESRFKHLPLGQTDVIHLALHGYADLEYPDRSALVFAPDSTGSDDGLLQVREIREMHLNSRLVTLSACNTGVGPVGDAGVVNLVNAFIEAGADSVVSTLWELSDVSTGRLMANFYAQLATHSRKVDALRSAQLDLMHQGLPPYYWASFLLVGDPNGKL